MSYTLIYEASVSPDLKTREIYHKALTGTRQRLLVLNQEYLSESVKQEAIPDKKVYHIHVGSTPLEVTFSILDNPKNWNSLANAISSLEPFGELAEKHGKPYPIPWLVVLKKASGDDFGQFLSNVAELKKNIGQSKKLTGAFLELAEQIPAENQQFAAILKCKQDIKVDVIDSAKLLTAIIKLFSPLIAVKDKIETVDVMNRTDDKLFILPSNRINDNNYDTFVYRVMMAFRLPLYLDTTASRYLLDDLSNPLPLKAVAITSQLDTTLQAQLLRQASYVYFNLADLNKKATASWLNLQFPQYWEKYSVDNLDNFSKRLNYLELSKRYLTSKTIKSKKEDGTEVNKQGLAVIRIENNAEKGEVAYKYLENQEEEASSNNQNKAEQEKLDNLLKKLDKVEDELKQLQELQEKKDKPNPEDPMAEYPDSFNEEFGQYFS